MTTSEQAAVNEWNKLYEETLTPLVDESVRLVEEAEKNDTECEGIWGEEWTWDALVIGFLLAKGISPQRATEIVYDSTAGVLY